MSANMSLHEPESMKAGSVSSTYWLKIEAENENSAAIFFHSPSDMVQMLHAALDSALELERKSKGRK